ncbi:hypothetical protein [Demequina sp.]|uniref:hypothetical protein n=1 Tax=Demequina sp. TaxID=2050685 RepID=UPI003D12CFA3
MTGAVERPRARRRAGWFVASVLAVAALAACDPQGPEPTPTPTPTFTYDAPSPGPTNTVDADGRALPGFVTVNAELPQALPAGDGLLATTGAGWSLQTYRPQVEPVTQVSGIVPGYEAAVQVLYLVSPEGKRYQLLELDPTLPIIVDSWTAGESVAYVRQCEPRECDDATPTQTLDLVTGALTPIEGAADSMHIGATLPGSVRWWQNGDDEAAYDTAGSVRPMSQDWIAASASPDGEYLAVVRAGNYSPYVSGGTAIVNAQTGRVTDVSSLWEEPLKCTPFRWRADDALDITCWDAERQVWRLFAVGPGAQEMKENKSATATAPEEGPWVEPDFFVSDGTWAGPYTADATARRTIGDAAIGLARNAGFEELTVPDASVGAARIVAEVGGRLYVVATEANNPTLETAWTYDVAAGEWLQIGPLPPAGPTRGLLASQGSPASGMTSWAIAP